MNNRLRKRYLGAGVVVALAAMILPFLLQGEGYKANRQLAEDAQTRIPPRPPLAASLDTSMPPPPEDVRAALIEPESLPEPPVVPVVPPAAVKPIEPAKPKPTPVPTPLSKPSPTPELKPVAKPVTEVKVKPLEKPPEKPAEKLPAKPIEAPIPIPIPKAVEKPAPAAVSKPVETPIAQTSSAPAAKVEAWLIQLGSFTAESNAQNLLSQVQRVGVSAKVERIEVKGSPVWRVTSGTYATRAEADAALKVLKTRLNLGGMVRSAR
ncbi:MAG: hypothetical protein B7Y40_07890 [Gammaproteobacteria bacterium 28-57-27]|nr:MAG: hypothetical protein B7Y40_07890 [Gammaproteobacteria bacterium 28-57-27]